MIHAEDQRFLQTLVNETVSEDVRKASSLDEVNRNRGIRFEHDANERSGTGHAQPLKNKS